MQNIAYEEAKFQQYHKRQAGRNESARRTFLTGYHCGKIHMTKYHKICHLNHFQV